MKVLENGKELFIFCDCGLTHKLTRTESGIETETIFKTKGVENENENGNEQNTDNRNNNEKQGNTDSERNEDNGNNNEKQGNKESFFF